MDKKSYIPVTHSNAGSLLMKGPPFKNVLAKTVITVLEGPTSPLITIGHALYILNTSRVQGLQPSDPWLKTLVTGIVRTVGGQIFRGLLTASPPDFMKQNETLLYTVICWWLVYHSPGDAVHRLQSRKPFRVLVAFLEALSKVRAITMGADKARAMFPGSVPAALILGTLSGSGGTLLADIEKIHRGNGVLGIASNFTQPSWVLKTCWFSSVLYFLLTNKFGKAQLLTPRGGKLVLGALLIIGYTLRAARNPSFNIFQPVEDLITLLASKANIKRN